MIANIILNLLAVPAFIWAIYLSTLALAAFYRHFICWTIKSDLKSKSRIVTVIPAHNEENNIGNTVHSLIESYQEADFDPDVLVIADNCDDQTAEIARKEGANVIIRKNENLRGKGYALEYALKHLINRSNWEAFAVVDADTIVDKNFIKETAQSFGNGSDAVQGRYTVLRNNSGWRVDLIEIAWSIFNYLRPYGRNAMGASSPILGNGFAIKREVLEKVPFPANEIVEDLVHELLLIKQGIQIKFLPDAIVYGQAESGEKASRTQRVRWESGRIKTSFHWIPRLLSKPNIYNIEAAINLSIPPLTLTALYGFVISGIALISGNSFAGFAGISLISTLLVMLILAIQLQKYPISKLLVLLRIPGYLFWKIALYFKSDFWKQQEWVRTERG